MSCAICNYQGRIDGATDQHDEFVCIDCWTDGKATNECRIATKAALIPGHDYSTMDTQKYLDGFNRKNK